MTSNLVLAETDSAELARAAHYREQATQFRQWADEEAVPEARDGLLDMARQYERLANELEAKSSRRRSREKDAHPINC